MKFGVSAVLAACALVSSVLGQSYYRQGYGGGGGIGVGGSRWLWLFLLIIVIVPLPFKNNNQIADNNILANFSTIKR